MITCCRVELPRGSRLTDPTPYSLYVRHSLKRMRAAVSASSFFLKKSQP